MDLTPEQSWTVYKNVLRLERQLRTSWKLQSPLSIRVAIAIALMDFLSISTPRIVSGYRSPSYQLKLINRWEAGNRSGLVSRPALSSWHMQGLAVDVDTQSAGFPYFRFIMEQLGLRWGGNFKNSAPNHFDLPIGESLTVYQLLANGKGN